MLYHKSLSILQYGPGVHDTCVCGYNIKARLFFKYYINGVTLSFNFSFLLPVHRSFNFSQNLHRFRFQQSIAPSTSPKTFVVLASSSPSLLQLLAKLSSFLLPVHRSFNLSQNLRRFCFQYFQVLYFDFLSLSLTTVSKKIISVMFRIL